MYKTILFPIDVSDESSWQQSLSPVIEMARAFKAKIHVMTVLPNVGSSIISDRISKKAEEEMTNSMVSALADFTDEYFPDDVEVFHVITQGAIDKAIVETSDRIDADLIIMTAHAPALKDIILGANSSRVLKNSNCSVLIVRDNKS